MFKATVGWDWVGQVITNYKVSFCPFARRHLRPILSANLNIGAFLSALPPFMPYHSNVVSFKPLSLHIHSLVTLCL